MLTSSNQNGPTTAELLDEWLQRAAETTRRRNAHTAALKAVSESLAGIAAAEAAEVSAKAAYDAHAAGSLI